MDFFFTFIYKILKKHRFLFFLLLLCVLSFCAYFAPQLKLEDDITRMMPKDASTEQINTLLKTSNFLDRLVVTVSAKNPSVPVATEKMEEYTDSFTIALQNISPQLIKEVNAKMSDDAIYQLYNTFTHNLPVFLEKEDYPLLDELITPQKLDTTLERNYRTLLSPASMVLKKNLLLDPIGITPYTLKRLQNLQVDNHFELYDGYIFTKDKKHLLFFITPSVKSSETDKNEILFSSIDSIIKKQIQLFPEINADLFGSALVATGNAKQIKKDVLLTISITIIGLFLFISFFFKRAEVFFLLFLPVIFGAAFSLAILFLLKKELSGIALGAGSIVLGIAMDYTIHFYTHYKHTRSAEITVKDLAFPLTLGSTTTIGAFLSLLFIKSEALQDFGLFAAFSLIGAAAFTLVFFPHLIIRKKNTLSTATKTPNIIEKIAAYPFDKNPYLIGLIILLCFISAYTSQNIAFESDMMKMNYMSKELAASEKKLNAISDVSLKSIYVIHSGKSLEDALNKSEKDVPLFQQLQKRQLIKSFSGINNLLFSQREQQQRIAQWNNYWTNEKKEKLKKLLIEKSKPYKFKENAFNDFYQLLDKTYQPIAITQYGHIQSSLINNYITVSPQETTIITILKTTPQKEDLVYQLLKNKPDLIVFNKKNLTNHFVEIIRNNFNLILTISSLLVLIMLIISYGRLELAFITYIPMVLSWLCILGLMGAFHIKFNIINIIVSTFIFGLGDDYSIFITDALLAEYKTGQKKLHSYKTGIFISAITTMIGIGVLLFASHPALQSIGLITIIGMLCVLLISNTLQPVLFRILITNRTEKKKVPFTFLSLLQSIFAYTFFAAGALIMIISGFIILKLIPAPLSFRKKIYHHLRSVFTKAMIYVNIHVKKKIINPDNEQFTKPAVIICNHHSVIDSLLMQSLSPKLILMVNDWVWKDPFMGPIVRLGGFILKEEGHEEHLSQIKKLIDEGYSLAIFPEGRRSETADISRFHKGAFYIAEQLQLDIVPILFHGTAFVQGKNDSFLLQKGKITVHYLPRIAAADKTFGEGYVERTKRISCYFKSKYAALRKEIETVDYFADRLYKNYIYKGPVLEWYTRIKVRLEDHYRLYESLLPKQGFITDIGCGYGFLSYMIHYTGEERKITGIDYDEEKIKTASHCFSKDDTISFIHADITQTELPKSNAFILSDILHYLPVVEQEKLLTNCIANLQPNGIIILRDADKSLKSRQWGTRYTEFFSTKFGFNKTTNKLEFVSGSFIKQVVNKPGMELQIIDNTKLTSNIIYVIRKREAYANV